MTYSGHTLETVLTGSPHGATKSVDGGAAAEIREIFHQLEEVWTAARVDKTGIVSARLYLQEIPRDIVAVNGVYREYFASYPPNRRAYDLQSGMLVEAVFVAVLPEEP